MNVVLGYTKIYYFYFPLPNKKIYILQVTIKSLKLLSHGISNRQAFFAVATSTFTFLRWP